MVLPDIPGLGNTLLTLEQPNIDVEVAIRDGALDLGVFGPTALMSKEKVDKLSQGLREELKKITEV